MAYSEYDCQFSHLNDIQIISISYHSPDMVWGTGSPFSDLSVHVATIHDTTKITSSFV